MATDSGQKLMKGLLEAFILESLAQEPKHGYLLLKEMEACFGQEPNRNKIYPLLQRLEKTGLIREVPDTSEEGRGRTLYTLTEDGERELDGYRRIPDAFKATVARIWPSTTRRVVPDAPADAPADAPPPTPDAGAPSASAPDAGAPSASAPAAGAPAVSPAPADAAAPAAGAEDARPYPCADARVAMEKDPRTGNLALRLTGCPMGAFDYCPQCPVYKSVHGLRVLTFGGV